MNTVDEDRRKLDHFASRYARRSTFAPAPVSREAPRIAMGYLSAITAAMLSFLIHGIWQQAADYPVAGVPLLEWSMALAAAPHFGWRPVATSASRGA